VIARLPDNKGRNYPDAECVLLNCTLDGVPSEGFGPIDESASTANLLEFNSHDRKGKTIAIMLTETRSSRMINVRTFRVVFKVSVTNIGIFCTRLLIY
jgi:hypothetical protein